MRDAPPTPDGNDVVLSSRVARDLEVAAGDEITLLVELPSDIPRDALLGKRDDSAVSIPMTVRKVLDDTDPGSRFGLQPEPAASGQCLRVSENATGTSRAGASTDPTPRDPRSIPARVNTIFVLDFRSEGRPTDAPSGTQILDRDLQEAMRLDDVHAHIVADEKFGYLSLESDRMILDRPIAEAAREGGRAARCRVSPVLAYIANEISVVGRDADAQRSAKNPPYSRYSVVAGLDPELFAANAGPPFGPYQFQSPENPPALGEGMIGDPQGTGEIVLNDWLARIWRRKSAISCG